MPKTDTPPAPADTEDQTNGATNGASTRRPVYAATKVDALPEDVKLPRTGPRTPPQFVEALDVAKEDAGSFYEVATFMSEQGAKNLLKRIQKKEVKVPLGDWDFEVRRMYAPNSGPDAAKPERWSKLYAKFLG